MKFKNIFTMALSLLVATAAFADGADKPTLDQMPKKDYASRLPVKGDMSLGFSLDPFATVVGNLFGEKYLTSDEVIGEPELFQQLPKSSMSLVASYMLTNNLSVHANLGVGFNMHQKNYYVQDDAAVILDDLSNAKVIDQINQKAVSGCISLGVEYRVGKTLPVQGVFGGGITYAVGMNQENYLYGNAITEINQNPSIHSEMPDVWDVTPYLPNARILSYTSSDFTHLAGIYGTIGAEWFVAPKVALGASVNLGIYYEFTPALATVYEGWNTITGTVTTHSELVKPFSHGLHLGTDNIGANFYIAFYFGAN